MACECEDKTITIYQGFSTYWNGNSLVDVSFDTGIDLTNFSAIFKVLNIEKTYTDIAEGFSIDLTKQETAQLPVGLNYGELIIVDNETHKRPFTTALPLEVKNWVSGDVHLDNFNLTVKTKIKKNELKIKIETPRIDPKDIEKYIEAHNQDESAHPYIRGLVSDETTNRENADTHLQEQINEIYILANGYVHEQGIASDVWEINHNLNKFPSVSVVDSSDNEILVDVEYIDNNNVRVTMVGASKGKAYLN